MVTGILTLFLGGLIGLGIAVIAGGIYGFLFGGNTSWSEGFSQASKGFKEGFFGKSSNKENQCNHNYKDLSL